MALLAVFFTLYSSLSNIFQENAPLNVFSFWFPRQVFQISYYMLLSSHEHNALSPHISMNEVRDFSLTVLLQIFICKGHYGNTLAEWYIYV